MVLAGDIITEHTMELVEVQKLLFSTKSTHRRRGARIIGKEKLYELGEELLAALRKERLDPRTWETQSEMTTSLGKINYRPALKDILNILDFKNPHSYLISRSAIACVRLQRVDLHDALPVIALLKTNNYSVIQGSLEALAVDRMTPDDNQITMILDLCWNVHQHKDRLGLEFGLIDPRIYLAIASAGWKTELKADFLNHCINTSMYTTRHGSVKKNETLVKAAELALIDRYYRAG